MKVQIEKRDLLTLISKTLNIVEKRNAMPVLSNVLLEATGGKLKVFATDLEVSLTDQTNADVKTEGKLAIQAKQFFDLVRELNEGTVTLTRKENNWLEVQQGPFMSKIFGISPEEYPAFLNVNLEAAVEMESTDLSDMIDKTLFSVSHDETRYHLNGVYFESHEDNTYSMVATDGHRLSFIKKKLPLKKGIKISQGVIIPRKGLFEIKKIIESFDGPIKISIEGPQLILQIKSTVLMIRLIEGRFPNYQQFIPKKLNAFATIDRDKIMSSLKRVSLLANQKSRAVTFNFSPNKLEISTQNPELGDAREELQIQFTGEPLKVGFNSKYIQDVLSVIDKKDVQFELNDNLSPSLIKPFDDPNYTCVVMPMKI